MSQVLYIAWGIFILNENGVNVLIGGSNVEESIIYG